MKVNWNRVIASLGMTGPYLGAPGLPDEVRINLLRSTTTDRSEGNDRSDAPR